MVTPLSFNVVLTCNASESGYGAHISFGGEQRFRSGMWSSVEQAKSSSFCELMAVCLALKSFQNFFSGKKVKIFSDNQNIVRIVHAGSSIIHLQQIAVDIFSFCMTNSVSFQAQWIPRGANELADYVSCIVDPDDRMTAVTILICLALILSFGVLVLKQWIALRRIRERM